MEDTIIELLGSPAVNVQLVRRFPRDTSVRRLQFEIEDEFRAYFGVDSVPGPISDDPSMPRFTISSGKKSLAVSEVNAILSLAFDSVPKGGMRGAIEKAANSFARLDRVLNSQQVFYHGLVVEVTFPTSDRDSIIQEIAGMCLMKDLGPIQSVVFTIGKKLGEYFGSISLQEVVRIDIESMLKARGISAPGAGFYFDADFEEMAGQMFQFKFDINTKFTKLNPVEGQILSLFNNIDQVFSFSEDVLTSKIIKHIREVCGL